MAKPKVVFLCQADHAGSCYQAAQAVNRIGRIQARHVSCFIHPFGFDYDIAFNPMGNWQTLPPINNSKWFDEACQLLSEADMIHCWNDEYHDFLGWDKTDTKSFVGEFRSFHPSKYKSITFTGTWYRRHFAEINARLMGQGTELVVQTPAFLMESVPSTFIPHAIDTTSVGPLPFEQRDLYTIGVYAQPTTTARKDIVLLEQILAEDFPEYRIRLKEKLPHNKNLAYLEKCMFFMQHTDNRMISYGRSSVEALAMGIPVFNSVCPQAKLVWPHLPVIDITQQNLRDKLKEHLNSDWQSQSDKAREFAVRVHSYEAVGEQYTRFFERLL